MEKSTLQIAEQVGLFLLPVVRGILSDVLVKAAEETTARMEALAVELRGAVTTGHARNLETLQGVATRLDKQIEHLAELQRETAGAMQSKASTDQLDAFSKTVDELGTQLAEAKAALTAQADTLAVSIRDACNSVADVGARVAETRESLLRQIDAFGSTLAAQASETDARIEKVEQRATAEGNATRDTFNNVHLETRALRSLHEDLVVRIDSDYEAAQKVREKNTEAYQVLVTNVEQSFKEQRDAANEMHARILAQRTEHTELAARVDANSEALSRNYDNMVEEAKTNTAEFAKVRQSLDGVEAGAKDAVNAVWADARALRSKQDELAARVSASDEATMRDIEKLDSDTEARLAAIASEFAQRFAERGVDNAASMNGLNELVEQRVAELREHIAETAAAIPRIDNDTVAESFRAMMEREADAMLPVLQRSLAVLMREQIAVAVEALPRPKDGADGVLPVADPYIEGDAYGRGAVVLHAGGMWQALRRTKAAPGAALGDWQALAVGVAGVTFAATDDMRAVELSMQLSNGAQVRSTVDVPAMIYRDVWADDKAYASHDVVTYDGSLWVSRAVDNAGVQPGTNPDKWRLIVKRGSPGKHGKDAVPPAPITVARNLYAGEYEEGTLYGKDSVVEYASSLWMAKRPTKERPPYLTNQDNEHWLRLR